jgi:hypothetical protein
LAAGLGYSINVALVAASIWRLAAFLESIALIVMRHFQLPIEAIDYATSLSLDRSIL